MSKRSEQECDGDETAVQSRRGETGADAAALWPLVMLRSDKWHFTAPPPRHHHDDTAHPLSPNTLPSYFLKEGEFVDAISFCMK